jgi:hypothetical protein
MATQWKLTTKQSVGAKKGSAGFMTPIGLTFTVVTRDSSQPQGKEIEGPFLAAVGATSISSACTTSWFKIEKA